MFKFGISRLLKMVLPILLLAVFVAGCAANSIHSKQGVVTGYILTEIRGYPGALSGHPEPNWQRPEPTPSPNAQLCFLMINEKNEPKLFTAQADEKGFYSIELPEGNYIIKSFPLYESLEVELSDKSTFIDRYFFSSTKYDEKGQIAFDREPDVIVKAGQTYKHDVPEVMYVD